jgi:hypothetical protein
MHLASLAKLEVVQAARDDGRKAEVGGSVVAAKRVDSYVALAGK